MALWLVTVQKSMYVRSAMQELTLHHPNIVNAKKNAELTYSSPTFLSRITR